MRIETPYKVLLGIIVIVAIIGQVKDNIVSKNEIEKCYKENYTFSPEKIKAIDYHIEGCTGRVLSPEVYEEYLSGEHGHGVVFFSKKAPLNNWTMDSNEKYFVITDRDNKCYYKVEL